MTFLDELDRLREAKGMTWTELGSKAGYSGLWKANIKRAGMSRFCLECVMEVLELDEGEAERLREAWIRRPRAKCFQPKKRRRNPCRALVQHEIGQEDVAERGGKGRGRAYDDDFALRAWKDRPEDE